MTAAADAAERAGRFAYERRLRDDASLPWRVRAFGLLLGTYMNADGSDCRPGTPGLMATLGASRSTVDRLYRVLRDAGYLVLVEAAAPGRAAVYAATTPTATCVTQVTHVPASTGVTQVTHVDGNVCQNEPQRVSERPSHTSLSTKTTTTTSAPAVVDAPPVHLVNGGGGGLDEEQNDHDEPALDDELVEAVDYVLDALDVPWRLGRRSRSTLAPFVGDVLRNTEWTATALAQHLGRNVPADVVSAVGLLRHRLEDLPARAPAGLTAAPARAGKPWCRSCDSDGYRYRVDDDGRPLGKCECHPGYGATA